MKKSYTLLLALMLSLLTYAQAPQRLSYQAVVRDANSELVIDQQVRMRLSILISPTASTSIWQEVQTIRTNENGLVSLQLGQVNSLPDNIFMNNGTLYLKTEVDPNGSGTYSISGTSQLLSVPYAMYSKDVQNNDDADANPTNEIQTLSISGTNLTLSNGGGTVTLPGSGGGGDNWGTQVVVSNASIDGEGTSAAPLKIAQQSASTGQVLKWNGTTWLPATDETGSGGATPTGPAGGDLDGTYPNPTLGEGKVTSAKVAANAITEEKIADAAISSDKLANQSVTGTKIAQQAATTGQVLKWNGSIWAPGTDEMGSGGSNPTGPAGGDLSGTYPNPGIGDGRVSAVKIATDAVTEIKIAGNSVTSSKIADGAVNTAEIANNAVTVAKLPAGATSTTFLRGDGSWTNPPGNAPGGGTGYIQFNNNGVFAGESTLFWNNSIDRLGIGTSTPDAPLAIVHDGTAPRRGLVVKSTSSFSAIYADAADGDAALLFLRNGELKWNTRNNPEFGNDNYQIIEITGPGVVQERMRIERSTGKVVFNGAVEVKNGKGIIRSIDNIQRKNLTTTVTVNTTINAGSTAQISFTFPENFTAAPVVYVGNATGGGFAEVVMTVAGVTTTGGKIFVYNPKSTSQSPNFTVNVVALGQE